MEIDYEAPPPRDRLPTLPEDLSEYAWLHTGPQSWSSEAAESSVPELNEDDLIDDDDGGDDDESWIDEMSAGLLVDLWHNDIPVLIASDTPSALLVDEREAHVVSLMDGQATVGTLLETSGLAVPDVLGTLCELCARGIVMLDRSRRCRVSQ